MLRRCARGAVPSLCRWVTSTTWQPGSTASRPWTSSRSLEAIPLRSRSTGSRAASVFTDVWTPDAGARRPGRKSPTLATMRESRETRPLGPATGSPPPRIRARLATRPGRLRRARGGRPPLPSHRHPAHRRPSVPRRRPRRASLPLVAGGARRRAEESNQSPQRPVPALHPAPPRKPRARRLPRASRRRPSIRRDARPSGVDDARRETGRRRSPRATPRGDAHAVRMRAPRGGVAHNVRGRAREGWGDERGRVGAGGVGVGLGGARKSGRVFTLDDGRDYVGVGVGDGARREGHDARARGGTHWFITCGSSRLGRRSGGVRGSDRGALREGHAGGRAVRARRRRVAVGRGHARAHHASRRRAVP